MALSRVCVYALLLFGVNAAVVWRLFSVEFTQHLNSNQGTFIAISRFLMEHGPRAGWFPYWFNGLPIEYTYSPVLPSLDALTARITGQSPALVFHELGAFFYCLGPVCLFLFAWQWSRKVHAALIAALLYSLVSPSMLFPAVRHDIGSWHYARRLHTLVHYGEGAHNMALSLLPLALLCAYFAITRRAFLWKICAGILFGALVLTNAFAASDLAIGLTALALCQSRGERVRAFAVFISIGIAAYVWISPLMPPALLATIRSSSVLAEDFHYHAKSLIAAGLLLLVFVLLCWITRNLRDSFLRFCILLALPLSSIPALSYCEKIVILPQPERYHLEMELAVCLLLTFAAWHFLEHKPLWTKYAAALVLVMLLVTQAGAYLRFARELIQPIDITQTAEYELAHWSQQHLPATKMMIASSAGTWFNVFSDNPQLSSGHNPFSPNWVVQHAVYAIYSGENAGAEDAANSIVWLKAFGCGAISVTGTNTKEAYQPYRYPDKFDGVLPLLWRENGDSIYGVPLRSSSLAHVIGSGAVVHAVPQNGLDLQEVRRFVNALEDPALPTAELTWRDPQNARIVINANPTNANPDQVIAVQLTYDPGWVASVHERKVAVAKDGIGLMTLRPQCNGACEIDLRFDGGWQRRLCWWASGLLTAAVLARWAVRAMANR